MQKCHKMVITFCYFEATIPMRRFLVAALSSVIWIAAALQSPRSQIFTDVTSAAGFRFRHEASHTLQKYLIETMGSGVACLDYDGDGTFQDVTERAGVGAGGWSTGAAFFDYDGDGKLDLIVARYLDWDFSKNIWCGPEKIQERGYCHPNAFQAVTHVLYHNNGNGTFSDVSRKSGISAHPGKGLGLAINDSEGDGRPDIVIANDSVAEQLFRNNGDGTFTELAL